MSRYNKNKSNNNSKTVLVLIICAEVTDDTPKKETLLSVELKKYIHFYQFVQVLLVT